MRDNGKHHACIECHKRANWSTGLGPMCSDCKANVFLARIRRLGPVKRINPR